jgi:hypothetical protein
MVLYYIKPNNFFVFLQKKLYGKIVIEKKAKYDHKLEKIMIYKTIFKVIFIFYFLILSI